MSMHNRTHTRMGGDKCASPNIDDRLLTRSELARRWKVSIETLKRRERAKILRPVKLTRQSSKNALSELHLTTAGLRLLKGRIIRYRITDVLRIEEEAYCAEKGL